MPVQKILHPGGNSTLLGLIVGFPLLYGHGGNVKADIFTLHRAHIQGTRRQDATTGWYQKIISFPPSGFHTAVAVNAKTGNTYPNAFFKASK